ncbi:MAG: hypothetical protein LBD37_02910 [Treponema sp.]|jgi:hypothetical protein|nr:hypothetical protein [Treponema sp.]
MILNIDVKDDGVVTLLRDMERLDLLHIAPRDMAVSPVSAAVVKPAMTEAEELESIKRNAAYLNGEMADVLLDQAVL